MANKLISRLIIDTDAGVDDAMAIIFALGFEGVDLLAITTCWGNTSLDFVIQNVAKTLHVCNKLDIPIYLGANQPLVRNVGPKTHFHGTDGLGDTDLPQISESLCNIQRDIHAALALIELTKKYPGEITLITIGPMTNLALAIRLDSSLPSRVKQLVWMGGSVHGRGNSGLTAEFNVHADPESAHIVLSNFPMSTMISWELTLKAALTWEVFDELLNEENDRARFLKKICAKPYSQRTPLGAIICDVIAVAIAIDPSLVQIFQTKFVCVELQGEFTRGQTAIDWYDVHPENTPNVCIVDEININRFIEYMYRVVL